MPTRVLPDATRPPDIRPDVVSAPLWVRETLLNRIDPAWLQFLARLDREALEVAQAMEGEAAEAAWQSSGSDAAGSGGVA